MIRKLDRLWEVFSVREIYVILAVVSPVGKLEVGRHELEGQQRKGVGGLHPGSHQDLPKRGRWKVAELAALLRCCQNIQVRS